MANPWAQGTRTPPSQHLWVSFLAPISNGLPLSGNHHMGENSRGRDEMREKCLCPQFADLDASSHPKLYHLDQTTPQTAAHTGVK